MELTDVFTDIFNISLSQAVVPTCFKATTIIPVPKKSSPSCFNDYRPVALTPILMKCFERLVMQHIKSVLPPSLDPFQFAYRSNRSTYDAIATALHPALTHLDKTDTYVRLLFIDFSSAFNTIIPQQLIHKLVQLGLQESALSACSSDHQWCDRGESEQHQVPGCTHHRGPLLDQQHCSTSQESTTASLLPPQTKKSQSPGPHHVHLLQRHHREHSD